MKGFQWWGIGAAVVAVGAVSSQAIAVQLADGMTYFERPPSLLDATSNRDTVARAGGTYYFTLDVPENAGEPLGQVAIAQYQGNSSRQRVEFEADETTAFQGTRSDRGEGIRVSAANFDDETRTLSVIFEPAIAPGTTVTVAARPERNPRSEGVYLFGVTAYPEGVDPYGQFLGYGRFHFYSPDAYWWR
jgi:hypothetical protein